jgi:outer membrane protein OmpA-like peptidoglycan-associated protein
VTTPPLPTSPVNTTAPAQPTVPVPRDVTYRGNSASLSVKSKAALTSLIAKLVKGASVTIVGYAYHDARLAQKRADLVASYLRSVISIHVRIKIVTSSAVGHVMILTTKE